MPAARFHRGRRPIGGQHLVTGVREESGWRPGRVSGPVPNPSATASLICSGTWSNPVARKGCLSGSRPPAMNPARHASRWDLQSKRRHGLGTKTGAEIDTLDVLTYLDMSRRRVKKVRATAATKISSKVEESVWKDLQQLAGESHQSISGLLTEAIREYVRRRRVRPEVLRHLDSSIAENEELGRRLAQ